MAETGRSLFLVIHALGPGGAERVATILANAWAARGDPVSVATFTDRGNAPFFPLDPRIRLLPMGENGAPGPLLSRLGAVGRNLARVRALRRAIKTAAPGRILSFMNVTNVLTIAAAAGTGIPVVVTEHIDPSQDDIGPLWTRLRRLAYPHAARLAVLSGRVLDYFPKDIRDRSVVVPNPVLVAPGTANDVASTAVQAAPSTAPDVGARPHTIVAMGRMTAQKGFDLLLEAFASVAGAHPAWRLEIWGEGPLLEELGRLRDRLALATRVTFPGRTGDAYGVLRAAVLYVLSSRYEGFPMVLCEAMAVGLPVIAFDCRTGPREIVRDGTDGVLVPPGDVARLAAALDRLMADGDERRRLGARAPEVCERFGLDRVLALWDRVFDEAGR